VSRTEYLEWCAKWGFKPDVVNVAGKEVKLGPGVGKRVRKVLQDSHDDFVSSSTLDEVNARRGFGV
jgi:hypothetical protein